MRAVARREWWVDVLLCTLFYLQRVWEQGSCDDTLKIE